MDSSQISKLAEEWIEYQKLEAPSDGAELVSKENSASFEPVSRLMELTWDDWPVAISICAEIANQSSDPWILEILGAGPLEDILHKHGYEVLDPFLTAAKANPSFRQALRHIWECKDPYVWEQFLRVRDKLASPDIPKY